MSNLETLQKQRQATKSNVNLVSSSMPIGELECRSALVEAYFKRILQIQNDIEILYPQDMARADLVDLCIKTKFKIIELLADNYKRSSFELAHYNSK